MLTTDDNRGIQSVLVGLADQISCSWTLSPTFPTFEVVMRVDRGSGHAHGIILEQAVLSALRQDGWHASRPVRGSFRAPDIVVHDATGQMIAAIDLKVRMLESRHPRSRSSAPGRRSLTRTRALLVRRRAPASRRPSCASARRRPAAASRSSGDDGSGSSPSDFPGWTLLGRAVGQQAVGQQSVLERRV